MKITTSLPFPSLSFRHWWTDGREVGVLVVKGTFKIREGDGALVPRRNQDAISLTDVFEGAANETPLGQESDLAPFKPKTDVTFEAVARAPEGKALQSWPVRFDIEGRASYGFHVFGERFWEPERTATGLRRWKEGDIKPVKDVPLSYSLAYGGTVRKGDETEESYDYNPVGCGLLSDFLLSNGQRVRIPQVGLIGDFQSLAPDKKMTVCGVGPVAKSWLPRLPFAGTFDQSWQRERHPLMPVDYDFAYWNAAPMPLQMSPYLKGDEIISVRGIHPDPAPVTVRLPGFGLVCRPVGKDGTGDPVTMNLDTVHCRFLTVHPVNHRITMVWRLVIENPDDTVALEVAARYLSDPIYHPETPPVVQGPRPEDEEARRWLIENRTRTAKVLEASGWTKAYLAGVLSASSGILATCLDGRPSRRHIDPQSGASVVVLEDTNDLVHMGKPDYLYGDEVAVMELDTRYAGPNDVRRSGLSDEYTIYVPLKDDNVQVWRPVSAYWVDDRIFCIKPGLLRPEDETWVFGPSAFVECERRVASGRAVLLAVRAAPRQRF